MSNTWNCETKAKHRDLALQFNGTSQAAILFPGEDLACLNQGIASDLFDPDTTTMICIDKDERVARKIERQLKAVGFQNYYVHCDMAHTLSADHIRWLLEGKRIDFAFFDFCNTLNGPTAEWISTMSGIFQRRARVSFTFAIPRSYQKFLEGVDSRPYESLGVGSKLQYSQGFTNRCVNTKYPKATIVGTWMAMSMHSTIKFRGIHGYRPNYRRYSEDKDKEVVSRSAMMLIRTEIEKTAGCLKNMRPFWSAVFKSMAA